MHTPTRALMTDLYQLTMAQAYFASGLADTEACFHLYFRTNPFDGGFAVAAGLEQAVEFLDALSFSTTDIDYLAELRGNDRTPLFSAEFLEWLSGLSFELDVDAMPEGTVCFPREPLVRVRGTLPQCQIVETALLNIVNFQTLVATKAARVCLAAEGDPVMEFGLRRAQGPDGGLSASRASFIGGVSGTSNTYAGITHGIPVLGTHAHSWVMAFDTEIEAFEAYAAALPNNCTFLVDTYDTLEGVRHACEVGRTLRERGHEMIGIRIDSGDLAWLSKRAREILDAEGFESAHIVASNELDEYLIASLKDQGARIDSWGVGTKLVCGWDQPALGGVYKLSAIREPGESEWTSRIKVSEQTAKVTTPGIQQVRRFRENGRMVGDMVYDVAAPPEGEQVMQHPEDALRVTTYGSDVVWEDLLVPVIRAGETVWEKPSLTESRDRSRAQVAELDSSHKRFLNPHVYKVGLERGLAERRNALIEAARLGRMGRGDR